MGITEARELTTVLFALVTLSITKEPRADALYLGMTSEGFVSIDTNNHTKRHS